MQVKKKIYKIILIFMNNKIIYYKKGSLTTTVEKVEGGYVLNGWKKFITNAGKIIFTKQISITKKIFTNVCR